jgi:hypothetical protein
MPAVSLAATRKAHGGGLDGSHGWLGRMGRRSIGGSTVPILPELKPTPADILAAIAKAELGDWIDPSEVPLNWLAELHSPKGRVYNGNADTPEEAMALAWLSVWAPDALINGYVKPGSVPFEIPAGWRFELTPPWRSKSD